MAIAAQMRLHECACRPVFKREFVRLDARDALCGCTKGSVDGLCRLCLSPLTKVGATRSSLPRGITVVIMVAPRTQIY